MIYTEAEFAEQIMVDLVTQGYSGNDLLEQYREEIKQIRPAVGKMLEETKKTAISEAEYVS